MELLEAAGAIDALDTALTARARESARALVQGSSPLGAGVGWIERRASLFDTVARVLIDVSHQVRIALVIHDLDAADAATQDFVGHLAALAAPTEALAAHAGTGHLRGALVLTGRAIPKSLLPGIVTTAVRLRPLDEDGVREFLNRPEVVAFFAEATGGRPRELEALLETLPVDAGGLLRTRWARTSVDARRLAATLAVAGRPLALVDLGTLAAVDEASLVAAAQTLKDARLCRREVVAGELRLSLLGRGDEEAIYALVPDTERATLHLAVGRWLSGHGGDELTNRVRIAEHLLRGGGGRAAIEAALRAVEALELTFGYDRAVDLLRRARAAAVQLGGASGHPLALAAIDARLCELERFVGDYDAALATAQRLDAAAPGPSARRRIAELHILRDELDLALAALDDAEREAAHQASPAGNQERVRIAAARAEALYLAGRGPEAKLAAEDALRRDEEVVADGATATASLLRIEVLNTLGKVALAEARYSDAALIFGENVAPARALGSTFEESRALFNLGITELRLGAYGAAQGHYQSALDLAESAGDHRNRAFCLQNLGVLAHWRGDYAEAIARFQAAVSAFRRTGMRARLAWVALDLASVYLDLNDRDAALATFGLVAQLGDRLSPKLLADCALVEARIEALAGRRLEARALALSARDAVSGHQAERVVEAGQLLVRLALDDAELEEAARLFGAIAPSRSDRVQLRTLLLGAELELARGEVLVARRRLRSMLPVAQRIADLEVEWRSHELLGRAALAMRDEVEANRHFRAALAIDRQLRERVPEPQRGMVAQDPQRRALDHALHLHEVVTLPAIERPRPALVTVEPDDNTPLIGRIIGKHPLMRQVCSIVERAASADSIVLIRGESGTGKELIAEALHEGSSRKGRPFIKVNCGAIVESLLLSELFGHERGAFTGALQRKKGRFESADGGTLFLDEVGDVSPRTQVALLRVLQERQFERVGGTSPVRVDVRIICATNRNLETMVASGEFRQDLYYRLRGIQLELPALRERASDIPLIAKSILASLGAQRGHTPLALSVEAEALLRRHDWPGNVRELENVLRSASLFAEGGHIAAVDLGEVLASPRVARDLRAVGTEPGPQSSAWQRLSSEGLSLKELKTRVEIECIERAVSESRGNITKAAELLGMKRPRLSQLIKEHRVRLDFPDDGAAESNQENP